MGQELQAVSPEPVELDVQGSCNQRGQCGQLSNNPEDVLALIPGACEHPPSLAKGKDGCLWT